MGRIEMEAQKRRIVLFDVDGTLVKPMGRVTPEMAVFLEDLRKILPTAIVGGSNFDKQRYQIGEDVLSRFDYVFSENGLVAFKDGQPLGIESIKTKFSIGGEISFDVFPAGWDKTHCLKYLQEYDEIYFYGDKTLPGGNDYEIFSHPDVVGNTVV